MRWLRRSEPDPADDEGRRAEDRMAAGMVDDPWAGEAPTEPTSSTTGSDRPRSVIDVHLDPEDLARATRRAVARALAEDLGVEGDATTRACVPAGTRGTAELVAVDPGSESGPGIAAGSAVVAETYGQVDTRVNVDLTVEDGDELQPGDVLARLDGPLRSILTGGSVASGLFGHFCRVASTVRAYVEAVADTGCEVRDGGSVTPGLRLLEKAAVVAGGGRLHRRGLFDALVVQPGHAAGAGGLQAATRAAREASGQRAVQVEVASREQLEAAIAGGATNVAVGDVTPTAAERAVAFAAGRARVEVLGVTSRTDARAHAEAGVDAVRVNLATPGDGHSRVELRVAAVTDAPPGSHMAAGDQAPAPDRPDTDRPDPDRSDPDRSDPDRRDTDRAAARPDGDRGVADRPDDEIDVEAASEALAEDGLTDESVTELADLNTLLAATDAEEQPPYAGEDEELLFGESGDVADDRDDSPE